MCVCVCLLSNAVSFCVWKPIIQRCYSHVLSDGVSCVCGNHIFSDGLCLCGCVYRALSGDATIADMTGISHLHREGDKGRVVVAVV